MPELPEVEAICRRLGETIKGRVIDGVTIRETRFRYELDKRAVTKLCRGALVDEIRRRGKYILVDLSGTRSRGTLLMHLGMSGQLRWVTRDVEPEKHDHFGVHFGRHRLWLRDPRRFGMVLTLAPGDEVDHPRLKDLGVEPLGHNFDVAELYRRSRNRSGSIRSFLMNAHHIVGIGNIYASEVLWLAEVHPNTPATRVGQGRWRRLGDAILMILNQAIDAGGTTLRDHHGLDGEAGGHGNNLKVYGRADEPCFRCSNPIRREKVSGRSSYFCASCQRG